MTNIKKIFFLFVTILAVQHLFAQNEIVVAQDGSGNFKTIQEAVNSLPATDNKTQRIILIKKGTYNEKIFIDKDFITLRGENRENTIKIGRAHV